MANTSLELTRKIFNINFSGSSIELHAQHTSSFQISSHGYNFAYKINHHARLCTTLSAYSSYVDTLPTTLRSAAVSQREMFVFFIREIIRDHWNRITTAIFYVMCHFRSPLFPCEKCKLWFNDVMRLPAVPH